MKPSSSSSLTKMALASTYPELILTTLLSLNQNNTTLLFKMVNGQASCQLSMYKILKTPNTLPFT
jgi:hypothetical protein